MGNLQLGGARAGEQSLHADGAKRCCALRVRPASETLHRIRPHDQTVLTNVFTGRPARAMIDGNPRPRTRSDGRTRASFPCRRRNSRAAAREVGGDRIG